MKPQCPHSTPDQLIRTPLKVLHKSCGKFVFVTLSLVTGEDATTTNGVYCAPSWIPRVHTMCNYVCIDTHTILLCMVSS